MNKLRRIGRHAERSEAQEEQSQAEAAQAEVADSTEISAPDHANGTGAVEAEAHAEPMQMAVAGDSEAVEAGDVVTAGEESGEAEVAETAHAAYAAETTEATEATEAAEAAETTEAAEDATGETDTGEVEAAPVFVAEEGIAPPPGEGDEETQPEVTGKTAPLQPEHEELTALPANAVITGKYVVQSQLHHGADRNLYRVAARRQQKCPNCGRLSSEEAANCEHCDAALSAQPPAEFYLMAESFRPDALMQDSDLMELKLYHPNLVPVVDFFSYTPFGRPRYYAVAEPRQGVRLSQMSMPRPPLQVFGWALQLADALDYLHSRGVVGAGAEADDILVQGDMASLASLQNARISNEDGPDLTQLQSVDLAKLASTIYEAYTGHPAAMSPEGILPMPSQAPDKVGAVFRSAIEPIQGISPAISAAQWRDLVSAALVAIAELEQPGRPVDFVAACATDVGRLRDQNQDSFAMAEFAQSSVEHPSRLALYVVADGMGGHKGGEIASAIAAQTFVAEVMARVMAPLASVTGHSPALTNEQIMQGMARAVQSANDRIYKARDSRQNDMGTTLVAALISGGKAYIINVGDSRLYFYTKREREAAPAANNNLDATAPLKVGTMPLPKSTTLLEEKIKTKTEPPPSETNKAETYFLSQVSVDHSLVHRLVELGQLDPEEAKVHPHRNFIYRSLGGPPPIEVDTFVRTLHPGDRLLLCSDGLNSMIEDDQIEAVLASESNTDAASQRLIDLANEAGGHDNITTIVVDVTSYLPLPEHPHALNGDQ